MVKSFNKSIGLLGGSFDPSHKGHLIISKIALKKIKIHKVLWVITKKNPFKKKAFYSLQQRIDLAKKITKNEKKIQVIHLDKTVKSSKSIKIIDYLIDKKKLKIIYFLIGSDNLVKFHKWESWKKIVNMTKLTVFSRKGYDRKGRNSIVAKYLKNNIIYIKNKHIVVSSTKLRNQANKKN